MLLLIAAAVDSEVGLGEEVEWLLLLLVVVEQEVVLVVVLVAGVAVAVVTDSDDNGVDGWDDGAGGCGDEVSRCRKSVAGREAFWDKEGPRKRSGSRSESRGAVLWLVISASPFT